MSKDSGYKFKFSVPKGWVQLPVLDNRKAVQRDRKLDAWSAQQARKMLNEHAPEEQLTLLTRQLTSLTYGARARGAMYGLALYPPTVSHLVAILDVKRLVPDRQYSEITFDVLRDLYAKYSADTVGDINETQADLPSGPALRVHRKRVEAGDSAGQGTLMEGVTLAIRPPEMDDAIVMIMTWTDLQLGERLAEMADAIAKTIKVTPA
jgi:hypothetical protein